MARVTNTLIGKSYGKVGGAVFSVWKGINVLKEKGIPSNPQTQAQMEQRAKMALFVLVFQQMAAGFKWGFSEMAVKMSEFNAFIKEAFRTEAYTGSYPSYALDASKLNASKGSLWPTSPDLVTADESAGTVVVDFATSLGGNQSSVDTACVIVYNEDQGTWNATGGDPRSAGTTTCDLPPASVAGDNLQVWLFFVQPVSGIVSDSSRTAATVVA